MLFFISEKKYFSINFPFHVTNDGNQLRFRSKNIDDIDNKITSDVIGVMSNQLVLESNEILDFAAPIDEASHIRFWSLIRDLLLFEDGYVRYDYDEENENELLHPLNHLDIFYSSNCTFKVGLNDQITSEILIDCLDIRSNCYFLNTP